ncbi:MAG: hypothetical protein WBN96_10465 [Gammaproteobacteria bacterium]
MMKRLIIMGLLSGLSGLAYAADEAKELSGISIIGNKEAPKSLYIVPWKNSEVGVETSLTSGLLDESSRLVDKEVFMRELDFYELSQAK